MRILWLKTELLHPVDKGGKIRTYQMLRHIRRRHRVTYLTLVAPDEPVEAFAQASEYCSRLIPVKHSGPARLSPRFYRDLAMNLASPLPFAIQKYQSVTMQESIDRELRHGQYDVAVADFLTPSVNLIEMHMTPAVLFQHNVESTIWQRHYETERQPLKRAFFQSQWQKMERFERAACGRFDAVVAVSPADRDRLRDFGARRVFDVATGIDAEYFKPLDGPRDAAELVFTGSMDWMPNEDAMVHFVERILPRIAAAVPDVKVTIVGRNPSRRVRDLAAAGRQVTVTGRVGDVRPYLDRAAVCVVPLRIGGGTRLKIFEAMAMAKPVVSTTIGAEGLPLSPGRELLIADEPESFAVSVISLLQNSRAATTLGQNARTFVRDRFRWENVADTFIGICAGVAGNGSKSRAA